MIKNNTILLKNVVFNEQKSIFPLFQLHSIKENKKKNKTLVTKKKLLLSYMELRETVSTIEIVHCLLP